MAQQAHFRKSLTVGDDTIPVEVNGSRVVFGSTTAPAIPDYTGRLQTGVQKWLGTIGGGTARIEGATVVAELPNHTFTEDEIDQAETHLATALTRRKGMGIGT